MGNKSFLEKTTDEEIIEIFGLPLEDAERKVNRIKDVKFLDILRFTCFEKDKIDLEKVVIKRIAALKEN